MLSYELKSSINIRIIRFKCYLNKCYHDIFGHECYKALIREYREKFILPYGDNSEEYW